MLKSLRNRLILSHLLPSFIIIPLMGVILIYVVESRILLPTLTSELSGEALLLAEMLHNQPDLWQSQDTAHATLTYLAAHVGGRLMLLDSNGRIWASSDTADTNRLGSMPEFVSNLPFEQADQLIILVEHNPRLDEDVIDILVPMFDQTQNVTGQVRITYRYETVYEQLFQFRYWLGAILSAALLIGAFIGYILAVSISSPVQFVAEAIYDLARGGKHESLPLSGTEEIDLQVHAVNFLVDRLDSLEKARQQLLANLVHELGRPLGALRSGSQALLRGAKEDPELLDELLVSMDEELARLQLLLDDLAHLHEQVLGTLELDRQPLYLSQWLPQVLLPWQKAAQSKQQHLQTAVPPDLPAIAADAHRLAQVVGNLLSNAIKYTPAGGQITVSAGPGIGEVWIRISDNGPGIPPEEQQAVFDPFFRGTQKQRLKQGMGLGLSITRDLIVAHGGRLELDSQLGQGSSFTVWMPRSAPTLEDIGHEFS